MAKNKRNDPLPIVTDEMWQEVNKFNRNMTEEFLQESVQLSKETLKQYTSALRIFFNWVREHLQNKQLTDIKSRDYLRYQNYLIRYGLSSSATRLKRSAISSLNGYVLLYYEDEFPTFKNFISKKIPAPEQVFVYDKVPLNPEEYEKLTDELRRLEEWQKLAYVEFTYSTGCRRAESIQLLKEIIDYPLITKKVKVKNKETGIEEEKEANYYVTHKIRCKGKGETGKERKLKFKQDVMDSLKKWLEIRGEDDCSYIFITKYGGKIKQVTPSTIGDWCNGLFADIIGRRVHPHLFRESRATNLVVHENKDIEAARSLLGHNSTETTKIYVIKDEDDESDVAMI